MNVALWPVRATRDRSLRFGHRLALRASHSQRGEIARDGLALCRRRRNSGSHGDGSFTRISGHRRGKPGLPRWANKRPGAVTPEIPSRMGMSACRHLSICKRRRRATGRQSPGRDRPARSGAYAASLRDTNSVKSRTRFVLRVSPCVSSQSVPYM
jgi:hypothetical protein